MNEDEIYQRRFRGYDTEAKCWRYGAVFTASTCRVCFNEDFKPEYNKTCIAFISPGDWNMPDRIQYCNSIDPESVGQCTGLKDSKGNEIFEGDCVGFDIGEIHTVGTVRWMHEQNRFAVLCDVFGIEQNIWECENIEVYESEYERYINPEAKRSV